MSMLKRLIVSASFPLSLFALEAAAQVPDCCKDFKFHSVAKIGSWQVMTGSKGDRDKEITAVNFAVAPQNAAWGFNCIDKVVTYSFIDPIAHEKNAPAKLSVSLDHGPAEILSGEGTGAHGRVDIKAGTVLIELMSKAKTFQLVLDMDGEKKTFNFENLNARKAILKWGRMCGIHA